MKKVLLSLLLAVACMPMAIGQKAGTLVTTDTTVCGKFVWIDGNTYTSDTAVMYTQGENIYVLNLTMLPATVDTAVAIPVTGICSASWNNKVWDTPGSFIDTLTATNGCDSIVKIEITLGGTETFNQTLTECGSYTAPWGTVYTENTDFTDSTIVAANCSYSATLHLTINPDKVMPTEEVTAGCSYNWNGIVITDTETHTATLATTLGCDSVISLRVTAFSNEEHQNIEISACDRYIYNNDTLTTSGVFTETDTVDQCVTFTHINLTVHASYTDTASVVVRDTVGGCRIAWMGNTYTFGDTNTVFYAVGQTAGGCDSLMALRITAFNGTQHDTTHVDNCGTYRWTVNGERYSNDTIVSVTNTTATCTEIQYLDLHIVDNYDTTVATACESYTYTFNARSGAAGVRDRATFTATGIYDVDENGQDLYSVHFSTGCKTYHTVDVTIIDVEQRNNPNVIDTTVCDKFTISFGGVNNIFTENADTTLLYARRTERNCYDTTIHLVVHVNYKSYADYNETVCDSYFWPFTNETYTSSTVETKTLEDTVNVFGCDSVGRLNLTVNYTPEVTIEGDWHLNPEVSNTTVLKIVDNPSDHNTYKWFKNNEATPFSTADSVTVTVTANTDIHLQTTSNTGCVANNWITVTYNVGIDEAEGVSVNLYPNPASRYLNVESTEGISEVVIYNAIGQQVVRRAVNATSVQLDLGTLATGTYTMQILSANGEQALRKFIINK